MLTNLLTLILLVVSFYSLLLGVSPNGYSLPELTGTAIDRSVSASDPRYPVNVVGHLSLPYVEAFAVQGNYIYAVAGSGLSIIDISNPTAPELVSHLFFESGLFYNGVGIAGSHAFVIRRGVDGQRYLVAVDVSDPEAPVVVNECLLESLGYSFLNYGNYLVILDPGSICVVDIADPANPSPLVRQVRSQGWRGAFYDNYLFTIEGNDIRVVDFADPTAPSTLTTYSEFSNACYLTIEGGRLYVVDNPDFETGGIIAIDITDPSAPQTLGFYVGLPFGQVEAIGPSVYGTRGQNENVYVIDFTNPASPERIGSVATESWGIIEAENRLYFELLNSISIFDASNPINPVLLGNYVGTYSWAHDIDVRGNLAALACGHLLLIDIADRTNPQILSSWFPPGYGAWSVELADGIAYVADGQAINAVDISDLANPVLIDRLVNSNLSMNILKDGNYAYSTGGAGVQVIDLSDPLHPSTLTIYQEPGMDYTTNMRLRDQTLFVHWTDITPISTVSFLDVTDPSVPVKLGAYVSSYSANGKNIELMGEYLYLIEGLGNFDVIDISTLTNATKVGSTYLSGGNAGSSAIIGEYVYITSKSLSVVDPYLLMHPQEVSTYFFGALGEVLTSDDSNLFLFANGSLFILDTPTPVILIGDSDNSGNVNISDVVFTVNYIFNGGGTPLPYRSADVNCDRQVTISDAVYLIQWIFSGGTEPCGN